MIWRSDEFEVRSSKFRQPRTLNLELPLILLAALLLWAAPALAQNPWFQSFTPIRTFWVSATGTGFGTTEENPMSLSAALAQALPGDLYNLLAGDYGTMSITRSGTSTNPIVWRSKRGQGALHDRATILNGRVIMNAQHNWVWGLEGRATAPVNTATGGGSGFWSYAGTGSSCTGSKLINNYIPAPQITAEGPVIGYWNHGPDRVLYGNIVGPATVTDANSHLVYGQNLSGSMVYLVQNILYDARDTGGPTPGSAYNIHLYSDTGEAVRDIHLEKNIFQKGRNIIGEGGTHTINIVMRKNMTYDIVPWSTHKRPFQFEFTDNYMGQSHFELGRRSNAEPPTFTAGIWGQDSGAAPTPPITFKPAINIFKRNTLVKHAATGGWTVQLRAIAIVDGNRTQPVNLDSGDQWDENTYDTNFLGRLSGPPGDTLYNNLTFAQWKTQTAALGATNWDANSTIISPPSTAKIFLHKNEYEAGRGNLAIFNWGLASSVPVDIGSDTDGQGTVIANGQGYKIVKVKDYWGTAVASGTYGGGTVTVPITGGQEFEAFVVLATDSGVDTTPPAPPTGVRRKHVSHEVTP